MGSPRPIICTLCKNDQQSFLFKVLEDDEYDVISERYDVDRTAYFCMLCIKRIRRKIERRRKIEEQKKKMETGDSEDSYDSMEEKQKAMDQRANR